MTASLYRFFHLRPSLTWTLAALAFLWACILFISWGGEVKKDTFRDLEELRMIELTLQARETSPEITVSDQAPAEEKPAEEKPLQFGTDDENFKNIQNAATAPRPRFSSLPRYPDSLRHEGIEGTVIIELGIDETGRVIYGKITRSLGRKFDRIVIDWAKKIFFYPARTLEGTPFRCRIRLPVRFKLDS